MARRPSTELVTRLHHTDGSARRNGAREQPPILPIHLSVAIDVQTLKVDALDPDERAAVRAFLQRSEVRLSTIHRVATR